MLAGVQVEATFPDTRVTCILADRLIPGEIFYGSDIEDERRGTLPRLQVRIISASDRPVQVGNRALPQANPGAVIRRATAHAATVWTSRRRQRYFDPGILNRRVGSVGPDGARRFSDAKSPGQLDR